MTKDQSIPVTEEMGQAVLSAYLSSEDVRASESLVMFTLRWMAEHVQAKERSAVVAFLRQWDGTPDVHIRVDFLIGVFEQGKHVK